MNAQEKHNRFLGYVYSLPMGIWITVFFVAPLAIIVVYSFLKKGLYGGVVWEFSLDAYKGMANPAFLVIVWRTIWISALSTAIILLISLPCGYAMARSKHQTLFLFLVIIPFWTNSLIRIYAWINLLSTEGFINNFLQRIGIISSPLPLINNAFAVVLVLVYMYIPYAVLPLFTTIDKFDFALLDAARDLGATKLQAMLRVLLPNIRSGITTALVFTFIPIFGAYTVPLLVGGMSSTMVGNIIVDQVQKTRNWPLASAFSVVLTIISMAGVLLMVSSGNKEKQAKKTVKSEEYMQEGKR